MLDYAAVFSTNGVVLWSHTLSVDTIQGDPINTLIKRVLLVDDHTKGALDVAPYKVYYAIDKKLEVVAVAMLQLSLANSINYVEYLLELMRKDAAKSFGEAATRLDGTGVDYTPRFNLLHEKAMEREEMEMMRTAPTAPATPSAEAEDGGDDSKKGKKKKKKKSKKSKKDKKGASDSGDDTPKLYIPGEEEGDASAGAALGSPEESGRDDDDTTIVATLPSDSGEGEDAGATTTSAADTAAALSIEENRKRMRKLRGLGSAKKTPKAAPKPKAATTPRRISHKMTKAERDAEDARILASLDMTDTPSASALDNVAEVKIEEIVDDIDTDSDDDSGSGGWFATTRVGGLFARLTGRKELTSDDVDGVLAKLRDQLTTKNVAPLVAARVCDSVKEKLMGRKLDALSRVSTVVKEAMKEAIEKILTPEEPRDVLAEIKSVSRTEKRAYVIAIVGVNGVGKTTSLAKTCYFLKAHGCSPVIAACDSFRSAAVEQLAVHAKALKVPLYQEGYGKKATVIAQNAIAQANKEGHDVVLVDTAGRLQTAEKLMKSLAGTISTIKPDLTLFVGEAMVGNDGIDQLKSFNTSLEDYSTGTEVRGVDGVIMTKYDLIDDKVGTALSLVMETKIPIVFVGTGQKYTDFKKLSVSDVVKKLMA